MIDPPVAAPETALSRLATELLHASCDPHLIGHCERSFQFAGLVAQAEGITLDLEVLYIGTVLHDIGLAPRFAGPGRFEMRGANVVRNLLTGAGMDVERAEAVWDVIALHASPAIAAHKSAETRLANRGISIDVRGVGADALPPAAVRSVLDRWPRLGFPDAFERTLIGEVRENPSTARACWLESIAVAHVPGYTSSDFLGSLHSSREFA